MGSDPIYAKAGGDVPVTRRDCVTEGTFYPPRGIVMRPRMANNPKLAHRHMRK
jgi:hypothetical protein